MAGIVKPETDRRPGLKAGVMVEMIRVADKPDEHLDAKKFSDGRPGKHSLPALPDQSG